MEKYELTEEKMEWFGRTLYRIRALKDFGDVKAGQLGGWVQSEKNLSQEGNAWVYGDAQVYGDAWVSDDAAICTISHIGSRNDTTTFFNRKDGKIGVAYGCFKLIEVSGMELVLYGRLDALKAGEIYDIKFSKGYERGKYIGSTQHPVYLELVQEAEVFTYIVSNGSEVWTERYRRDETADIRPIISDFLDWLLVQGLLDLYKEKWQSR